MADLTALQTKLETLGWLAAGLKQDRVAVGVAVELLHGRLLDGGAAAGAGVAAGGAEGVEAGGAGLQQAQEQHRTLARQTGQQQVKTGVCGRHSEHSIRRRDLAAGVEWEVRENLLFALKACQTPSQNEDSQLY